MNASGPRLAVIVVAAGDGTRLGAGVPKALVELAGVSLLARSLRAVLGMGEPVQVIVVAPPSRLDEARAIAAAEAGSAGEYVSVVAGGASRQASVAAGLAELGKAPQCVLVHDAARALAPADLFDRVAAAVAESGHGIVPGLSVADTIKRVDAAGGILETVDRSSLAAVQTPQGFPREHLVRAYAAAASEFTDDAALVADSGGEVSVIDGDPLAFKITTAWDLQRAERMLEPVHSIPRVGIGTDTHAFTGEEGGAGGPGDEGGPGDTGGLWLAGLHWPGEPALAGHSDGDVVAHAMVDALLAAAGLGDIGGVFGTDDARFAGAHAEVFLGESVRMLHHAGFAIGNVSVQFAGERPRFADRRAEAEAVLSGILGAPVSIAATTTDGLGFTGRGEGLTAIATALVLPASGDRDARARRRGK